MKLSLENALNKAKKERSPQKADVQPIAPKTDKPAQSPRPEDQWQAPVYSETRHYDVKADKVIQNRCICISEEPLESEFYKVLRAQVQSIAVEKGWRTFMVTSAQPGEGKTLTSINLALSFAKAFNQTVLLVDADLRKQQIHNYLGIPSDKGLKDYLLDGRPIQECLIWPGVEKLVLMSGGRGIHNSAELMGSPMMKNFVQEVRDRYEDRYIFFDAPPVLVGADAIEFAQLVDGILMMVDARTSSKKTVHKAVSLLPQEKICGIVFNRYETPVSNYYNYYAYGKNGK